MRILLLFGLLMPLAAQSTVPPAPTPTPDRQPQWQQRLRRDLRQSLADLRKRPPAYRGTLLSEGSDPLQSTTISPEDVSFRGGRKGALRWYTVDGWQVVVTPTGEAVKRPDGSWSEPRGDAPEVPALPDLLLPHFLHAELSKPQPSEFHGRPAVSVHARWQAKAAKQVVMTLTVPDLKVEAMLEALASAAARGRKNLSVDGRVLYDPATGRWFAATLRFALLQGEPLEPGDERLPPPPAGLPQLLSPTWMQAVWTVERAASEQAPMPALPDEHRRRLGLPAAAPRGSSK
ncbi:MAG TPA: hypothetical protein ENI87_07855 [bacterium]|nr:hypothetical protein [bacterium]